MIETILSVIVIFFLPMMLNGFQGIQGFPWTKGNIELYILRKLLSYGVIVYISLFSSILKSFRYEECKKAEDMNGLKKSLFLGMFTVGLKDIFTYINIPELFNNLVIMLRASFGLGGGGGSGISDVYLDGTMLMVSYIISYLGASFLWGAC